MTFLTDKFGACHVCPEELSRSSSNLQGTALPHASLTHPHTQHGIRIGKDKYFAIHCSPRNHVCEIGSTQRRYSTPHLSQRVNASVMSSPWPISQTTVLPRCLALPLPPSPDSMSRFIRAIGYLSYPKTSMREGVATFSGTNTQKVSCRAVRRVEEEGCLDTAAGTIRCTELERTGRGREEGGEEERRAEERRAEERRAEERPQEEKKGGTEFSGEGRGGRNGTLE
eukprot:767586-Hanusia_phi.AAC.2